MKLFNRTFTRAEIERQVGDMSQLCGIQAVACSDGLESGTRLLRLWNASGLQLDVIPDRAMDVGRLYYKGIPLTWSSGTGYVHPAYLQESGWPGGFHGGLVATCGLNNVGPASREGDEAHEQHGRISRLPASRVSYETVWEGDELALHVHGTTHDRNSKGDHLELERHIAVAGDKSVIRIRDRVTNRGIDEAACMLMYHMNFGFPLIDEQTELRVPAACGATGAMKLSALGAEVEVAYIECACDKEPYGEVAVSNPKLGMEVMIRYSQQTLPYLWRWHNRREGMRVFCRGAFELPRETRGEAKAAGCLPTLKPGESRSFELEVEVREY